MKFWPRLFLAASPKSRITSRSGGKPSGLEPPACASGAAALMRERSLTRRGDGGGELQGFDEAVRRGAPLGGDVERGAVVGRGAHERQPERDVDALIEAERLQRDQRLVVIHGDDGVIAAPRRGVKQRVGRVRPRHRQTFGTQVGDGRRDRLDLLAAHGAFLAGVRVEPSDGDARGGNAEVALQRRVGDARRLEDQRARDRLRHVGERAVHGERHDAQLVRGEHHHRPVVLAGGMPLGERGQELGVAGEGEVGAARRRAWRWGW